MKLIEIAELTEDQAREHFENVRWVDGPVCPFCGNMNVYRLGGKAGAAGQLKCGATPCRKKFTIKTGTVMESSPIKYKKWLLAFCLMAGSKKGFSAQQLHRSIGVTYKTAWFMWGRIRHAMQEAPNAPLLEGVVEVDETYVGGQHKHLRGARRKAYNPGGRPPVDDPQKTPVVALVERGGRVRSMPSPRVTAAALKGAIRENVSPDAHLMTDEFSSYHGIGKEEHVRVPKVDRLLTTHRATFVCVPRKIAPQCRYLSNLEACEAREQAQPDSGAPPGQ